MTLPLQAAAYVDTTALFPVTSGEMPVANLIRRKLDGFTFLFSSNLLEAEMRVAFALESMASASDALSGIRWIMPNRRSDNEMTAIMAIASLHPVRLWHLAVALFFAELAPLLSSGPTPRRRFPHAHAGFQGQAAHPRPAPSGEAVL